MDARETLITSFKVTRPKRSNMTLNSLLARAEQTIYDRLLINREIDSAGAAELLTNLHAGDDLYTRTSFTEYLSRLQGLDDTSDFSFALDELMQEVNNSTNPAETLLYMVNHERATGLVTEQNILPENFFQEPPLPDQTGAFTERFRAEFVGQKPSMMERAKSTVKGWFGRGEEKPVAGGVQMTELDPLLPSQAVGDPAFPPGDPSAGWPAIEADYAGMREELFGLPSWDLRPWDFERIREYFTGEQPFSNLSPEQATLVESLRYTPEKFQSEFGLTGDTARYHELSTQLRNDLMAENVLSRAELDSFVGIDERVAVSDEEFSAHFGVTDGRAISMQHAIDDINVSGTRGIFEELPELVPPKAPVVPEPTVNTGIIPRDTAGRIRPFDPATDTPGGVSLNDEDAALMGRNPGIQRAGLSELELGTLLEGLSEVSGGPIEVRGNVAFTGSGGILLKASFLEQAKGRLIGLTPLHGNHQFHKSREERCGQLY